MQPSVSLRQTFTDNARLEPKKSADSITELTGGLLIARATGWVRGALDYAVTASAHARHDEENDLTHRLQLRSTAELLEGRFLVDVGASIQREAISAFGVQAPSGVRGANQSEVSRLWVSPTLRGPLGPSMSYEARIHREWTRADSLGGANSDVTSAQLHVEGVPGGGRLRWTADAMHQQSDYIQGRATTSDRVWLGVGYLVNPELRVGLTAGRERTDLLSTSDDSRSTYGATLDWRPTPRTSLAANVERRAFGTSHAIRFTHRTPLTAWSFTDTRSVDSPDPRTRSAGGTLYDLFFLQMQSAVPDPAARDAAVRSFMRSNGLDPNTVVVSGFLPFAQALTRSQSLAVALIGVRNTLTLQATRNRTERADKVSSVADDLAAAPRIRQQGLSINWAHRLTPLSSLDVWAAYQQTRGELSSQRSSLTSVSAAWTQAIGARTSVTAGLRHANYDNAVTPYTENAIYAAARMAF